MRQMKIAKPDERLKDQKARRMPGPFVQPFAAEGSFVGGFVFQRKQEHQRASKRQKGKWPERKRQANIKREPRDQTYMPQQMQNTRSILTFLQSREVGAVKS